MQQIWTVYAVVVTALFLQSKGKEYSTCTHAIYSEGTDQAFCDFWYITQSNNTNDLKLCDCKENNGKYCTSWICARVSDYPFFNTTQSNLLLSKLLLPNNIDIVGVVQCGYFSDQNNHEIPRYCYKYDDFESCFCLPHDDHDRYCQQWMCEQYIHDEQSDLSLDKDRLNTSVADGTLANQISDTEYECIEVDIDSETCVEWKGTSVKYDNGFGSVVCNVEEWNSNNSDIFIEVTNGDSNINMTMGDHDLVDTVAVKWECEESVMSVNGFCLLCGNETKTEIICDSISDVCGDWAVDSDTKNLMMVIVAVASVCGCVVCVLCVVCLVFLRRKCVRGHGYVGGYELAAV